jgi:hypothetical protein
MALPQRLARTSTASDFICAPPEGSACALDPIPDTRVNDSLANVDGTTDPNNDFSPTPLPADCAAANADPFLPYDGKKCVPTQRPWVELGFPFYGSGAVPPADASFSFFNPLRQKFYLYGDLRVGAAGGRNVGGELSNAAARLNLEADWQLTATERFHAAVQPLNDGAQFTRLDFDSNGTRFVNNLSPDLVTGFFEGDLGVLLGATSDSPSSFDLPFAVGLLPLSYQNGIWMDDIVVGAAFAIPSQNSRLLDWSNYDATFFAGVYDVTTPALNNDQNAGRVLGSAWFIEAYGGYIEADWAYVHDDDNRHRSYHNLGLAFTRRYFHQVSNSVRAIINVGQELAQADRTADGGVLLIENSLISPLPTQLVPYLNTFIGWDRPQSVARNAQAGGILRNTGINFETDGLNGYPTLEATAANTYGGAMGVNWLGLGLNQQVVLETAYVRGYGDPARRLVVEDEWGVGLRYQVPLSHATLFRADAMYGLRDFAEDLFGLRCEWRWKF